MQDRDNFLCMQCWPFSCAGECNRVGHLCPTLTASEVQPYSCISILPRSPKDAFATAPVPKHEQIQQVREFPVFQAPGNSHGNLRFLAVSCTFYWILGSDPFIVESLLRSLRVVWNIAIFIWMSACAFANHRQGLRKGVASRRQRGGLGHFSTRGRGMRLALRRFPCSLF